MTNNTKDNQHNAFYGSRCGTFEVSGDAGQRIQNLQRVMGYSRNSFYHSESVIRGKLH
ncbi:hypothetical protein [Leptospira santarosai]|uniref:hypothetical protein n=1 Tax=Leptospira santarosai TaxID=28183 RepID=UPI0018AD2D76|nr:hypothetical protein [Leptospira santarosai]